MQLANNLLFHTIICLVIFDPLWHWDVQKIQKILCVCVSSTQQLVTLLMSETRPILC